MESGTRPTKIGGSSPASAMINACPAAKRGATPRSSAQAPRASSETGVGASSSTARTWRTGVCGSDVFPGVGSFLVPPCQDVVSGLRLVAARSYLCALAIPTPALKLQSYKNPFLSPRNLFTRAARVGKREGREYFIISPHVVVDALMIRGLRASGRASSCRPAARRRRGAVTMPQ